MPIFLNALKQSGLLDRINLTICNVGSRKVSAQDDYANQAWRIFAPNLTIYGFDADPEACEIANAEFEASQADWNEFHLPYAIAEKTGGATLYVTQHPMCSSLYPPNEAFLNQFIGLSVMNLEHTLQIETISLDDFCSTEEITKVDFIQADVQGAELQVLKGAQHLLQGVLALQVEVEYAPMYIGQPLFSEVDRYLRQQGFALFDLTGSHRCRSIVRSALRSGQLLWGDAIYLREISQAPDGTFQDPDQAFKLACIADALDFGDYALQLLKALTLNHGTDPNYNFAPSIIESISQLPGFEQSAEGMSLVDELRDRC